MLKVYLNLEEYLFYERSLKHQLSQKENKFKTQVSQDVDKDVV